jgi:dihydroxyacetone kinase-like predicted kinase
MLALYDGQIVGASATADAALELAFRRAPAEELEIVTIYHGSEATKDQAQSVAARIREAHPGLDVEVVEGGQPHYPFVVSLE